MRTLVTGDICPCCDKPLPEWRNYCKTTGKCRVVVMK